MANFLLAHKAIGWWAKCVNCGPLPLIYDVCLFAKRPYLPINLNQDVSIYKFTLSPHNLDFGIFLGWSYSFGIGYWIFPLFVFSAKDPIYKSTWMKTFLFTIIWQYIFFWHLKIKPNVVWIFLTRGPINHEEVSIYSNWTMTNTEIIIFFVGTWR